MQFNILKHPIILLKSVAAIMYMVMGILILLNPELLQQLINGLTPTLTKALAALLIVYGIFRLNRIYNEIKLLKSDEQE